MTFESGLLWHNHRFCIINHFVCIALCWHFLKGSVSHNRLSPTYKSNEVAETSFEFHLAKDIQMENADSLGVLAQRCARRARTHCEEKYRVRRQATPAYSFSLIEESGWRLLRFTPDATGAVFIDNDSPRSNFMPDILSVNTAVGPFSHSRVEVPFGSRGLWLWANLDF